MTAPIRGSEGSTETKSGAHPKPDRAYPEGSRLLMVCLVASLGGLLFGFDTAVISGTVEQVRNQYQLSSLMEGWFTSSALVGCIMGAPLGGFAGDRYGRKPALLVSAVLFFVSALYSMIPPTFTVLVWARWIGGVGVGMASVIAPLYVSEFAPPRWRGRLVATYQLSIVVGILLAYYSNWVVLTVAGDPWTWIEGQPWFRHVVVQEPWRAMFGAECLPAGLFFLLLWLVPESPRWLAQATLNGRSFKGHGPSSQKEARPWRDLFRPGIRRALLVAVMLSVFGQLSGVNIIVYYGPRVLAGAGYEAAGALLGQVGFGFINLIFTVVALFVIDRWGRRPLLVGGMTVVTLSLIAVGALFYWGDAANAGSDPARFSPLLGLWVGIMLCVYVACIALSICAVIWVLIPEVFPTDLRGRGTAIATFANWSTNAISALLFPWYVQTFGMHAFFVTTAAICAAATYFFWRFVPETRGQSLEDIERLWQS